MTGRAVRTVWVGARALLTALLVATVGVLALFVGVAGVVPASAATATYTYDTAAYAYDGPARLASPATVASCALGSPSGLEVASWGRSASARGFCTAAETGAARFTVNSAGEATMSLRAGSTSLEVSEHAALRMTQRGISIDAAEATLAQQPFPYFHQGAWKTGFYDPASRIFLGSVNGEVTTVIRGASPNYINNLKAATP